MTRTVDLLLIDDNPGDIDLFKVALDRGPAPKRIHVATDGVEALRFLRREGPHASAPLPHLILLDLNLPGKDGRSVLSDIKTDPTLRLLPVVVFSSSASESDVAAAYDLGANCFLTKPVQLPELLEVLERLEAFWLHTVRLPVE